MFILAPLVEAKSRILLLLERSPSRLLSRVFTLTLEMSSCSLLALLASRDVFLVSRVMFVPSRVILLAQVPRLLLSRMHRVVSRPMLLASIERPFSTLASILVSRCILVLNLLQSLPRASSFLRSRVTLLPMALRQARTVLTPVADFRKSRTILPSRGTTYITFRSRLTVPVPLLPIMLRLRLPLPRTVPQVLKSIRRLSRVVFLLSWVTLLWTRAEVLSRAPSLLAEVETLPSVARTRARVVCIWVELLAKVLEPLPRALTFVRIRVTLLVSVPVLLLSRMELSRSRLSTLARLTLLRLRPRPSCMLPREMVLTVKLAILVAMAMLSLVFGSRTQESRPPSFIPVIAVFGVLTPWVRLALRSTAIRSVQLLKKSLA